MKKHMKNQFISSLFIITIPLFFVSCISSLFKAKPPTFSDEIRITEPGSSFIKYDTSVFPSWKNNKTGNVIAIVSDCNEGSAYGKLSELHNLVEAPLEDITLLKEDSINLYNKTAIIRIISAKLDGHPIEVRSVIFKKKLCGYVATLSGKLSNLEVDQSEFDKFINGFSFK